MAAFPLKSDRILSDYNEMSESVVERTQMERGIQKQRRISSDSRVELQVTLLFTTKQEAIDFETWFYSASGANAGAAFFDFTVPRTGTVVQARIVSGDLGQLIADRAYLDLFRRQIKLEWWRSTWS
jgi:hypothetical protein